MTLKCSKCLTLLQLGEGRGVRVSKWPVACSPYLKAKCYVLMSVVFKNQKNKLVWLHQTEYIIYHWPGNWNICDIWSPTILQYETIFIMSHWMAQARSKTKNMCGKNKKNEEIRNRCLNSFTSWKGSRGRGVG